MDNGYNRRDFLKFGITAGAGLAAGSIALSGCATRLTGMPPEIKAAPMDTIRIGFVGVGSRSGPHLRNLVLFENVEIKAVCDIKEEAIVKAQRIVTDAGRPKPVGYCCGERGFEQLCAEQDLDLVMTATPWRWHVPVCVAAMKNGKHAATEVPAAVTIDECWEMVETAEKTRKYCIILENCCYGHSEMMVLNMVRKGAFGELLHCEAGYMHDLRAYKLSSTGEGLWRGEHSVKRNGNLYPTHGLGPVAQCLNINRGNQFDYLVSMSTKARGLSLYANKHLGPDHPRSKRTYLNGDVNSSLIRTVNGETIILQHDCDTPRPYNRIKLVQGTKGIFKEGSPRGDNIPDDDRVYIEGKSPGHSWELLTKYFDEYDHPLWKALAKDALGRGHGGMDYIMTYRLIKALRTGTPPDMDVYDAAAWSAVSQATERSVANRSRPVDLPDFTRGKWKTIPPLGIIKA